uniref:Uncharacterized protein n=1 Tax=Otus sunia TaxID=257818 RepID=A0A8C8A8Y7_9STRI
IPPYGFLIINKPHPPVIHHCIQLLWAPEEWLKYAVEGRQSNVAYLWGHIYVGTKLMVISPKGAFVYSPVISLFPTRKSVDMPAVSCEFLRRHFLLRIEVTFLYRCLRL